MALMPGQAKETMRMETTAKRPSYESILLEGEAKGADVSYFDGMVVSQFQAEPTYEKKSYRASSRRQGGHGLTAIIKRCRCSCSSASGNSSVI